MKQSAAWVIQAGSDLAAARRVLDEQDDSTFCQALANYQQVVEKSVKAMVAALNESGVVQVTVSGNHTLEHEINGLDAVRRKKYGVDNASLEIIDRLFRRGRADIMLLCTLAPKLPKPGAAYPRNTEYPFTDDSEEGWTAPAAPNTFSLEEVNRAARLAWPLYHSASRFASSLRRRQR